MKKRATNTEAALLLAGAVCFDLGMVIIPAQAASTVDLNFAKIPTLSSSQTYLKIKMEDALVSSLACTNNKGKLVEFKGTKYCQTPKTGTPAQPR